MPKSTQKQSSVGMIAIIGGIACVAVAGAFLLLGSLLTGNGPSLTGADKAKSFAAGPDSPQAPLIDSITLNTHPSDYYLQHPAEIQLLRDKITALRTRLKTGGDLASNPNAAVALNLLDAMSGDIDGFVSNAVSDKAAAKAAEVNFRANTNSFNSLMAPKSTITTFPVDYGKGGDIYFKEGWGADRSHVAGSVPHVHRGTDIVAPIGTPILAIVDGVIERYSRDSESVAAHSNDGYQLTVNPGSADQHLMYYDHVNNVRVKNGEHVVKGQVLGTVGRVLGHHLHFGIKAPCSDPGAAKQNAKDPLCWIDPYSMLKQAYPTGAR